MHTRFPLRGSIVAKNEEGGLGCRTHVSPLTRQKGSEHQHTVEAPYL